jgi:hypothetical protein
MVESKGMRENFQRKAQTLKYRETRKRYYKATREKQLTRAKAWKEANPDRRRQTARAWYLRNRERALADAKRNYKHSPIASRAEHLRKKYGMSVEAWEAMFVSQGGLCAICDDFLSFGKSGACVDHDHRTGAVRGLLCTECNLGLGKFKDSLWHLERAAKYLAAKGS